ncbi:MAG: DUF4160 domain-containing protein [Oscillospiraceae bacterium]|nr:DUF4160 domain-containing protein [Oscillospiraceae bacterium]
MPVLSLFYGIIVYMHAEANERHHTPHIHVEYAGDEAVVSLDGDLLEGKIPRNKLRLAKAWVEIHRDDLYANWKLLGDGKQIFRIDPLK